MVDSRTALAEPTARTDGARPSSARVWCEVLPVTCADEHIVALTRHCAAVTPVPGGWHELPPGQHPSEVVVDTLTRDLGALFDQAESVVHSTSWRYENDCLVLTYLAALPPLAGAPPGHLLQPVHPGSDGAARTSDPTAIPVIDVIAHGLRHLAMLRISDPTIADTLSECWHRLLARWNPLPAGLLEHRTPSRE